MQTTHFDGNSSTALGLAGYSHWYFLSRCFKKNL